MDELHPEDIEALLRELGEEYDSEKPTSAGAEQPLLDAEHDPAAPATLRELPPGSQAEIPSVIPEGAPARSPRSRTTLLVDIFMGAVGGAIIYLFVWGIVRILGLTEGEPPGSLFLGAAFGGAIAGVIVGASYRDWLFLRVFERRIFFLCEFGCLLAWVFALIVGLAEAVWVVILAFLWIVRMLSRLVRNLIAPAADGQE